MRTPHLRRRLPGVCIATLLSLLSAVVSGPVRASDGTWTRIGPPPTRLGQTFALDPVTRSLWWSGNHDERNEYWRYSLTTGQWDHRPALGGTGLVDMTWGVDASRGVVHALGGYLHGTDFDFSMWQSSALSNPPSWVVQQFDVGLGRVAGGTLVHDPIADRLVFLDMAWTSGVGPKRVAWRPASGPGAWVVPVVTGDPPPYRWGPSGAFDAASNRIIVFGGLSYSAGDGLYALELSGGPRWVRLRPAGEDPGVRPRARIVMDAPRNRVLMFGGHDNRLWVLHLEPDLRWESFAMTGTPPARRDRPSLMIEPATQSLYIGFGDALDPLPPHGEDLFQVDLGTFSSTRLHESPVRPWPPHHDGAAWAHDPTTGKTALWGGKRDMPAWSCLGFFSPLETAFDQLSIFPSHPALEDLEFHGPLAGPRPGPTAFASLVSDPSRQRLLLFGGRQVIRGCSPTGSELLDTVIRDTVWALSLVSTPTWTPLPTRGRLARHSHAAAWDSRRNRMLVSGGYSQVTEATTHALVREGDSLAWLAVATKGAAPAGGPLQGCYDHEGDRMLVLTPAGGLHQLDFADSNRWSPLAVGNAPATPLRNARLAYDPLRRSLIVTSGELTAGGLAQSDLWELDLDLPLEWRRLEPLATHHPRRRPNLLLQPEVGRLILHGGVDSYPDRVYRILEILSYSRSVPTRIGASFVAAVPEAGGIRLSWLVSGDAGVRVTLERERHDGAWDEVAQRWPDGEGRVEFWDPEPGTGVTTSYRVRLRMEHGDWVSAPVPVLLDPASSPGLRSAHFGADGSLEVRLAAAVAGRGVLSVYDLSGRRIHEQSVELTAGETNLRTRVSPLPQGIHWVRWSHAGQHHTLRRLALR
jgi:hypothetical protein